MWKGLEGLNIVQDSSKHMSNFQFSSGRASKFTVKSRANSRQSTHGRKSQLDKIPDTFMDKFRDLNSK